MSDSHDAQLATARQSVKTLNIQRQSLELESAAIMSELTAVDPAHPTALPMGVATPLTDAEGFPRNDIDVVRARTLRGRLAVIQTDHRRLMSDIEVQLRHIAMLQKPSQIESEHEETEARMATKPKPKYDAATGKWVVRNWDGTIAGAGQEAEPRSFDTLTSDPPVPANTSSVASDPMETEAAASDAVEITPFVLSAVSSNMPFARVDSVAPTSPAAVAGLHADVILAFGRITTDHWHDVADLVRVAAADQAVMELRVVRQGHDDVVLIRLSPRPWNGRGLLGCHIVPV